LQQVPRGDSRGLPAWLWVRAVPTRPSPDTLVRLVDDDEQVEFTVPCGGWSAAGSVQVELAVGT